MQSVNYLVNEHDLILRGLDLLEQSLLDIQSEKPLPEGFIRWVPDFFMNFADGCHHAKEEDVFFPALKEKGIPEEGGPIGVMLHEHVLGRDCNRRMKEAGDASPFDAPQYCKAATEFIPLLRQHIFKENNVLFKMAENVLNDAEDDSLIQKFSEVENQRDLSDSYKKFESDIIRWEKTMGLN